MLSNIALYHQLIAYQSPHPLPPSSSVSLSSRPTPSPPPTPPTPPTEPNLLSLSKMLVFGITFRIIFSALCIFSKEWPTKHEDWVKLVHNLWRQRENDQQDIRQVLREILNAMQQVRYEVMLAGKVHIPLPLCLSLFVFISLPLSSSLSLCLSLSPSLFFSLYFFFSLSRLNQLYTRQGKSLKIISKLITRLKDDNS